MNPRTGSVPESASTLGSAEAPDNAKVKDGAMVMTPAKKFTSEKSDGALAVWLVTSYLQDSS